MSVNMKQNGSLTKIASLTKAIIPMGLAECYSTEEREVGAWVDGKPLYQKTIDFGALPNNTSKSVSHGIANIDKIVHAFGIGVSTTSFLIIPFVTVESGRYQVGLEVSTTDVKIYTDYNRSSLYGYVTIQYTKTTDTAGGLYLPTGGGTDLKTTLANMGINATFIGEYSEIFNDFCHIVKLSDANVNGQGLYFTNNQTFASTNMTLTIAVTAKKGMIQIGYGTGTLPAMITDGTGRSQFVNIPAGGFGSISIPFGYVGYIGKFFRDSTDPVECVFEVNL